LSESTGSRPVRHGPYPELTWHAVLVGYLLGALIAVSIGYASLTLGFSIEGSELAAILGFAILRGLMRRTSIVENNVNQSLASSVNAASAGIMFSVPALFILNYTDFNVYLMIIGCISGGILGIAFIIPLRKQMIDFERLPYPGGIAVATILKSPGAGIRKAYLLIGGALVSGLVKFCYVYFGFTDLPVGAWLGLPEYMNVVFYVSVMTIGVGYLSGRGGIYFIVGGYVCFWMLAPILNIQDLPEINTLLEGGADSLRTALFRPLGIGMLIGGAVTGVALALPLIASAIRSMQQAAKTKTAASGDELPIRLLYVAVGGGFLLMLLMSQLSVPEMTLTRGIMMAILATLWVWMAGVILSECIGRTNWSPLSGMTLIAVTILIFIASRGDGLADKPTVIASVMVGAAACVAMSQATDLMLDLKTGYLVGALPKKQQIAQFLGTWLGPLLIVPLVFVLHQSSPLGGSEFPAPQGVALASVMEGILGGDVPSMKYLAGAGLGAMLSASGVGGLGILVGLGFYLPFNIVMTYSIGTVLRMASDKVVGTSWAESTGIPIAAGMIVGEALVGVGNAAIKIVMAWQGGGAG
jgi:putative OPT family oligopeptide transporter